MLPAAPPHPSVLACTNARETDRKQSAAVGQKLGEREDCARVGTNQALLDLRCLEREGMRATPPVRVSELIQRTAILCAFDSFLSITLIFAPLPHYPNHPLPSSPFLRRASMSSGKESPARKLFEEYAKNNQLDPKKWSGLSQMREQCDEENGIVGSESLLALLSSLLFLFPFLYCAGTL
jgi:hypothetical protein